MKRNALGLMMAATMMAATAMAQAPSKNIVEIAAGDSNFSTLVSLVKQAGLAETLMGEGPFTVFAPTNEAFAKLPKETLEAVKNDRELLRSVLLYHVVPGKVTAHTVMDKAPLMAPTALKKGEMAQKLDVKVVNGRVMVNNAKVVKTDIMGSNGVIHVVDSVLVPPMHH